ncbi:MAG: hypothetical protein WDA47_00355 [Bacilli bacterium]|jgi:hypothetical protein
MIGEDNLLTNDNKEEEELELEGTDTSVVVSPEEQEDAEQGIEQEEDTGTEKSLDDILREVDEDDDFELVELSYDDSDGVASFRFVYNGKESAPQDRAAAMSVLRDIKASDFDGGIINYSITLDHIILDGQGEIFVTLDGLDKLLKWMD